MELELEWLGRVGYREAWAYQHRLVAERAAGSIGDRLLLLEHPPVLTLGRHATAAHVRATREELEARGIELIQVERGGDVTYHGPGQLVAYPIVNLSEAGLFVRPFVRALEAAMSDTAASYGVIAGRRDAYPGCWCDPDSAAPRKLGALGLKVERGVTYHGIALNITTRLDDFELIDPCGLAGIAVTSIAQEAGWSGTSAEPSTASVSVAAGRFGHALIQRIGERVVVNGEGVARATTPAAAA